MNHSRHLLVLFLFLFLNAAVAFAQSGVTTVVLVRHAEKMTIPGDDPALTEEGKKRAELLMRMFGNSGIDAVYATQFARTRLTAEPLAALLKQKVNVIDANSTANLVQEIRSKHKGGTVFVVGHSNTLPEIVKALGVANAPEIDDLDYDNLFIVTIPSSGSPNLFQMKFFVDAEQVCK